MIHFVLEKVKLLVTKVCGPDENNDGEFRNLSLSHRNLMNKLESAEERLNDFENEDYESEHRKETKIATYLKFKRWEAMKKSY